MTRAQIWRYFFINELGKRIQINLIAIQQDDTVIGKICLLIRVVFLDGNRIFNMKVSVGFHKTDQRAGSDKFNEFIHALLGQSTTELLKLSIHQTKI